ncbi:MAG: hypothetical protein MUE82_01805 [Chloroflexi bacterium]|nr:hypothetical protein [Chloroflexota bacterium]
MGDGRRERQRNAGAFLGPYGTTPVPIRTLSDEIPREPTELEAERRGPRPAVRRTGGLLVRLRRALGWGSPPDSA